MTGLASVLRGDPWGASRAAVIAFGLSVTTLGYVVGRMASLSRRIDADAVEMFR
jgi:hypothetical protein